MNKDINFNNELNIDFNIDLDIDINVFEEKRYKIIKPKNKRIKKVNYKHAKNFAKEIIINKNTRYYSFIDGSFIMGDFIEAFLTTHKKRAKITLSTLSLSLENIDSFANLIKAGYIAELNIIISDYFYSHEKNNIVRYMYEELDIENVFQLAVCRTHTKITLIEFDDKKVVISGSANLRSSDNLEQVSIEENKELFLFNKEIHENIILEYKTINKSIKTKKLWQVVAKNTQNITEQEKDKPILAKGF
jgi:hypothetical protein